MAQVIATKKTYTVELDEEEMRIVAGALFMASQKEINIFLSRNEWPIHGRSEFKDDLTNVFITELV